MKFDKLCYLFFLILLIGCTDDYKNLGDSAKLTGKWLDESTELQYTFFANEQFELTRSVKDSMGVVLGYRFKTIGSFTIDRNQLLFTNMLNFKNDDEIMPYTSLDSLIPYDHLEKDYQVTYLLKNNDSVLTFDFGPCNDVANCLANQVFFRQ